MKKYYSVTAKCGHVGKRYYIPIEFAIRAESAKEAARITRDMPRVKHNHKDAIQSVMEISREEYIALRQRNDSDPYLHFKSVQEQRLNETIYNRLVEEDQDEEQIRDGQTNTVFYIGKKPIRHIKSFIKSQPDCTRFSTVRNTACIA